MSHGESKDKWKVIESEILSIVVSEIKTKSIVRLTFHIVKLEIHNSYFCIKCDQSIYVVVVMSEL